jgi:uncharacterized membrane protein
VIQVGLYAETFPGRSKSDGLAPSPVEVDTAVRRFMLVDVARGFALVLMVAYHFTFDLNWFFHLGIDFNHDPFWLSLRTFIVSLFLGLVGVSLHLATRHGFDRGRYARRLGAIVACAALITATTAVIFPQSYIYFGILHFIAVASLLGLLMVSLCWMNLWLGIVLVVIGSWIHHPWFDHAWLQWVGLMTHKPLTEDYVPLLPWFGVVLIGIFAGKLIYRAPLSPLAVWHSRAFGPRALAFGGRHSLFIYMVHQPVLWGMLYLLTEYV